MSKNLLPNSLPRKFPILILVTLIGLSVLLWPFLTRAPGDKIDEWNNVAVYHNGLMNQVHGRHLSEGGYNLGLT